MSTAYTEHYSVSDYRAWEGDWELIEGAPYAMAPSPSVTHQFVSTSITAQLFERVKECAKCRVLMEMDWDVTSDTVVRPDVMVICHEPGERVTRTPEMIFEVVSPRTAERDERTKFGLYEKEGVQWYALVYPERKTAKLYHLVQGRFQKAGDFADEESTFRLKECEVAFRFGEIWRQSP